MAWIHVQSNHVTVSAKIIQSVFNSRSFISFHQINTQKQPKRQFSMFSLFLQNLHVNSRATLFYNLFVILNGALVRLSITSVITHPSKSTINSTNDSGWLLVIFRNFSRFIFQRFWGPAISTSYIETIWNNFCALFACWRWYICKENTIWRRKPEI